MESWDRSMPFLSPRSIEKWDEKRARSQQRMNWWGHSTSKIRRHPPLEPIIWAMYAENGAANVISASHFSFIWTDTRLGSVGRLSMSSHQPCVRPHGRPSCCLPEALGTGSLNLWRGRTLCASPWPALNWSSVVCG